MILVFFTNVSFAGSDYKLAVCDSCNYSQMEAKAAKAYDGHQRKNIQVVDPTNGIVKGFYIKHESEPGFAYTNIDATSSKSEVVAAAIEAKAIIKKMKSSVSANEQLVERLRNMYPINLPSHLNLQIIPSSVGTSASNIKIGNLAHLALNDYLKQKIHIPISNQILGAIFASLNHAVISVFEADGSILVLFTKISTIRYEPVGGIYVDANGEVQVLGASSGSNTGSGSGNNSSNYGGSNEGGLQCVSWSIFIGTTSDGAYCDAWGYW